MGSSFKETSHADHKIVLFLAVAAYSKLGCPNCTGTEDGNLNISNWELAFQKNNNNWGLPAILLPSECIIHLFGNQNLHPCLFFYTFEFGKTRDVSVPSPQLLFCYQLGVLYLLPCLTKLSC